jgi:glycosyltransferase involved in cell wall biosynthesis
VPAGDYQALAESMAKVLTDHRLRMHLAHGARDRAEHYSWRRVGDRIEALYAKILAGEKTTVEA